MIRWILRCTASPLPIYRRAMEDRDLLNDKLLQRGKQLESAGYTAQVKVTAKSTLLFYMGDGDEETRDCGQRRREIFGWAKSME